MELTIDLRTARDLPKGNGQSTAKPQAQPTVKAKLRKRPCDLLVPLTEPEFRSFCDTHGISETALGF